jgi:hypothetical protein
MPLIEDLTRVHFGTLAGALSNQIVADKLKRRNENSIDSGINEKWGRKQTNFIGDVTQPRL